SLGATSPIYQILGVRSNSVIRAERAVERAAFMVRHGARSSVLFLEGGPPGGPATVSCDRDPCPFLPAGRTSRTLHAVRGRAKSVPRPTARRDAAHGCKGRAKGPGRSTRSGP